jgi:hypothetical protein
MPLGNSFCSAEKRLEMSISSGYEGTYQQVKGEMVVAFAAIPAAVPFAPVMGVAIVIIAQEFHHLLDPRLMPVIPKLLLCPLMRLVSLAGPLFGSPHTTSVWLSAMLVIVTIPFVSEGGGLTLRRWFMA